MTLAEMVGFLAIQLGAKLDSVVGSLMASTTSTDNKEPSDLLKLAALDAIASVASTVARSPIASDAFLFATQEADLGDGSGQYLINRTLITGPVICIDVSYDSSAFTYKFSEPDSPTAIQDYRALRAASRRLVPLLSHAIEGEIIHYPGTRIRVTFIPGDIGDPASDVPSIPRKYADWAISKALATLFPRDGGKTQAAQFYAQRDLQYTQMALAGSAELPEFVPYAGS